jgi:hypothetical protein
LAACGLLLTLAGAGSPWTWGPLHTDRIVVADVYDPKVGSGIIAWFAKVGGTTAGREKRDYFILYMGVGQTLPTIGSSCSIAYRHGRLAEWADRSGKPLEGRIVERFACDDGRYWPDGSPRR